MFRVIYMYVCPICKKRLRKLDNVWHCQNGHSFDIARKGYVNLLTTKGRNPKNAGDNAEMVKARTDFLDRDYYLPLAKKTAEVMGWSAGKSETALYHRQRLWRGILHCKLCQGFTAGEVLRH